MTDPKNADYEMESGATRNYEVWHDKTKTEEENAQEKILEETLDPMKALENRVLDSQREMEDLDALDEIKAMNLRHIQLLSGGGQNHTNSSSARGFDALETVLRARDGKTHHVAGEAEEEEVNKNGLTATEEALIKSIKFGHPQQQESSSSLLVLLESDSTQGIKRLDEKDEQAMEFRRLEEKEKLEAHILGKTVSNGGGVDHIPANNFVPIFTKKRRRIIAHTSTEKEMMDHGSNKVVVNRNQKDESCSRREVVVVDDKKQHEVGLGNLLGTYASDSD
jgi:hypothetical protein